MTLNRTFLLILSMAAVLAFSACSGAKNASQAKGGGSSNTSSVRSGSPTDLLKRSVDEMVVSQIYVDAAKAKVLEDYAKAVELYKKVLQLDPYNDAAQYELAVMYFESGQYEVSRHYISAAVINDSINYIANNLKKQLAKDSTIAKNINAKVKEIAATYKSNKWYLVMKADVLAYLGAYDDAAATFGKLLNDHPEEVDYYFDWAYVLSKKKDYKGAINVYNKAQSIIGPDENLMMQKQRVYLEAGMIDEAAAEIQRLIDANPSEMRYYQMLAELYQATERTDKAIDVYKAMLVQDPDNAFALLNMAEIYRYKGDRSNYLLYLKEAFKNPDLNIDSKIRVIYPYLLEADGEKSKKEEAFSLAQIVIEAHPNEAKAHAIYGDLLYQDEQSEAALVQYKQALQLDNSVYQVWQQVFFILSELQRYQELEKTTTNALELFPSQPIVYFFNGVANNQLNAYDKAVEILNIGRVLVVGNTPLKVQFYSSLGDAYNNLNKFADSDKAFEEALKLDSKNTYVLNNYSYYLSLRGEQLDKAKKMSLLSNTLEPENASFQDTYAWVLFKAGEYEEARKWIEKAIKNSGEESGVLLEHYGDILFKLGETGKALEYWQKALGKDDTSSVLPKKVADKKFYE